MRKEAEAVASEVAAGAVDAESAAVALIAGAGVCFEAMAMPGRIRLLLLDGPAVLGHIDAATGEAVLRAGVATALPKTIDANEIDALADMRSAAFERAAITIASGADMAPF